MIGYLQKWPINICPPDSKHRCQARAEWQPERCKANGRYFVKHVSTQLVVEVCGNHRRSLIKRGWRDVGDLVRIVRGPA